MTLTILIILLLATNAYREYLHHVERKDLYNRLMARNITEYHNVDRPPPKAPKNKFSTLLHKRNGKEGE